MLKKKISSLKQLSVSKDVKLHFCRLDKNFYLIIKHQFLVNYILVPNFVTIVKSKDNIIVSSTSSDNLIGYNTFINSLLEKLKISTKVYKKKLFLKGLGFKIFYNKELNTLDFKLGFSHNTTFPLPSSIGALINKNVLTLESKDIVLLGNILNRIRLLKTPDIYKGKGFWYKNEIINLKPIKKK